MAQVLGGLRVGRQDAQSGWRILMELQQSSALWISQEGSSVGRARGGSCYAIDSRQLYALPRGYGLLDCRDRSAAEIYRGFDVLRVLGVVLVGIYIPTSAIELVPLAKYDDMRVVARCFAPLLGKCGHTARAASASYWWSAVYRRPTRAARIRLGYSYGLRPPILVCRHQLRAIVPAPDIILRRANPEAADKGRVEPRANEADREAVIGELRRIRQDRRARGCPDDEERLAVELEELGRMGAVQVVHVVCFALELAARQDLVGFVLNEVQVRSGSPGTMAHPGARA